MILIIETSASFCSVCLAENTETILAEKNSEKANDHSEKLAVYVDELFKENGISASDLSAVALSAGPGSYTGLRIGASIAKGLCYAANLPLIKVDAFLGLVNCVKTKGIDFDYVLPHLDARRNEVYMQIWSKDTCIKPTHAHIIEHESFENLNKNTTVIIGDCPEKFKQSALMDGQTVRIQQSPMARFCAKEAFDKLAEKKFENLAYFEPYYLKDFIPGSTKKFAL